MPNGANRLRSNPFRPTTSLCWSRTSREHAILGLRKISRAQTEEFGAVYFLEVRVCVRRHGLA